MRQGRYLGSRGLIEVTEKQLSENLRALGIARGDHLSIGVALSKVGWIEGGPDGFIDAILDVLGPEGTLMVNTHNYYYFHPEEARAHPFDITVPCITGAVAETLRKRPGAQRSHHPSKSVAAIGRLAGSLTSPHTPESEPYLPYAILSNVGGKSLFIGLGDNLVAIRHAAQYKAGLINAASIELYTSYREDGRIETLASTDYHACCNALHKLVPHMRQKGLLIEGMIGNAQSVLVDTKKALDAMTEMLVTNPALTLCDEISCVWCRELERNLELYDSIEDLKIFQSNSILREFLKMINARRMRGSDNAEKVMGIVKRAYRIWQA
jgi:aminoglycoside 3-N-acetyltransferase